MPGRRPLRPRPPRLRRRRFGRPARRPFHPPSLPPPARPDVEPFLSEFLRSHISFRILLHFPQKPAVEEEKRTDHHFNGNRS